MPKDEEPLRKRVAGHNKIVAFPPQKISLRTFLTSLKSLVRLKFNQADGMNTLSDRLPWSALEDYWWMRSRAVRRLDYHGRRSADPPRDDSKET